MSQNQMMRARYGSTNYNGGLKVSSIFSSHWCKTFAFVPSTELNSLIRKLDSRGTGEPGRAPINKTSTEGSTLLECC